MKKLFLSILTVVFLFAACDKEILVEPNTTNNEVELTNTPEMGKKAPSNDVPQCNCDFITGTTPMYPWNGKQIADVSLDGTINVYDIVILQTLINDYDQNNDGSISEAEVTDQFTLPSFDYNQTDDIDPLDPSAARNFWFQTKNISSSFDHLNTKDLECIQDYLLCKFECP